MKRSTKPSLARTASPERAFELVEAGIAEIVAGIARERRAARRSRTRLKAPKAA